MHKLAIFLVIYFRNALKFIVSLVTQEESGLGMIESSEVVAGKKSFKEESALY